MFAATAVLMLLASPVGEVVETTRNLELGLTVIEAFEHGPVILDVTLTNRGKKALSIRSIGPSESRIVPPAAWKAWWPLRICGGFGGSIDRSFEPGETQIERHRLHLDFISKFPAGTYQVEASWLLTFFPDAEDKSWNVPLTLTKTFPVTISPATAANRWALAARLEAEFAALPFDVQGILDDPLARLADNLSHTPHKELIPLALRMLDRVRVDEVFSINDFFRRRMVECVFRADPDAAHRLFVDRLLATPRRCDPRDVFPVWEATAPDMAAIGRGYFQRITNPKLWVSPAFWHYFWPEEEVTGFLYWANYDALCIMPASELKRLSSAKDFTVRAWIYHTFGQRLGPAWCDEFLKEARRAAESKPDAKKPQGLDPALEELIFTLVYGPENTHDKHLLDIFLAGAKDNPIAIATREKVAEREQDNKERKR